MRFSSLFLGSLLAVFFLVPHGTHAATTTVSTCAELQAIPSNSTSTYELSGNISCSGISSFTPVNGFGGILEGNGFTINNFRITSGINGRGLFNSTNGAVIRNVNFVNALVLGNFENGILIASAVNTQILNVFVSGTIYSGALLSLTGGVVGTLSSSTMTNVGARIQIPSSYSTVGGLVGNMVGTSTISRSYAEGSITAFKDTGSNDTVLGGLVGNNDGGTIVNSYARVAVSGTGNKIGGLVGRHMSTSTIDRSYAAGLVSGSGSDIGGLVGYQSGSATTTNSYWDTEVSGRAGSAGGTGLTTLTMKTELSYPAWDFFDVWILPDLEYPFLRGSDSSAPTFISVPTSTSPTSTSMPMVSWSAAQDIGLGLRSVKPYYVEWGMTSDFSGAVYATSTSATTVTPTSSLAEGSWYFRVRATDKLSNVSAFATSSAVVIDQTAPILALNGSAVQTLTTGETFVDPGATADDAVSGNISGSISVNGTVSTAAVGTYTLTYTVADPAGNAAVPKTRTVTVGTSPIVGVAAGGGGFTVGPALAPSQPVLTPAAVAPTGLPPVVSEVFSTPVESFAVTTLAFAPSAGASSYRFGRNLRLGMRGDDVREMQKYLNEHGFILAASGPGSLGQETTYFGVATERALMQFQERYSQQILVPLGISKGTGLFYDSTRRFVNEKR